MNADVGRRAIAVALVAAVTALGAVAGPAHAGEKLFEGHITEGRGKIDFFIKRVHGEPRVKHFHGNGLPAPCSSGSTYEAIFGFRTIELQGRHFEIFDDSVGMRGELTVDLEGRLKRGGRAVGTVRASFGFDGTPICDTGALSWKARR